MGNGASDSNAGDSNTAAIVAQLGTNGGIEYAAHVCDTSTEFGYTDWYLPSKNELLLSYTNQVQIGGFTNNGIFYWSSTEYNGKYSYAVSYQITPIPASTVMKSGMQKVRCIRH